MSHLRRSPTVEQLYVKRGRRYLPVEDRRQHDFDRFPAEGVWLVLQQLDAIETQQIAMLERPDGEEGAIQYALRIHGQVRQVADMVPVMQFAQLWPLVERLRSALKEHEQERWRLWNEAHEHFDIRLSAYSYHVVSTLAAQLLDERPAWKRTGQEVELARAEMPYESVLQLVDICIRLHGADCAHERTEIINELRPLVEDKEPLAFLLDQLHSTWTSLRVTEDELREWEAVADLVRTSMAFKHKHRRSGKRPAEIAFEALSEHAREWHARHSIDDQDPQA